MYKGESILTGFQAVGHLDSHLSTLLVFYCFNGDEMLRLRSCPEAMQRLSHGSFKACGFAMTLCIAPNHTRALTGIQRD